MPKQVHVEPERIRRFASDLKGFRDKVGELTVQMRNNLSHLSDSWQDHEYENFAHAFVAAQQRLRKFSDEVEQTLPKLERDAERADEIHNVRLPSL